MKKLFSTAYSANAFSLAMLIARLVFGGLMIPHGFNKLVNYAKYSQNFSDPFHIGHPTSLILVIFAEFFCAILVLLGLFTRLASIPLIITMIVAVFHIHHGEIFGDGGLGTLFLGGFLTIFLLGPGKISMDKLIGK